MDMKQHILSAMQEEIDRWEELLAGLSGEQIALPLLPSHWTIKDEIAHLMAWQQRSIARMDAARLGRDPEFPRWVPGVDPDDEGTTEQTNAWIYETYRELPWPVVHQNWRAGFQRFIDLAAGISEKDLLEAGKYSWMKDYPLVIILLASYDHHREHYEMLLRWLEERQEK